MAGDLTTQLNSLASRLGALVRRYRLSDVYAFGSRAAEVSALVRREATRGEYDLYVLRRAGDLAPFEQERRRMILTGDAR